MQAVLHLRQPQPRGGEAAHRSPILEPSQIKHDPNDRKGLCAYIHIGHCSKLTMNRTRSKPKSLLHGANNTLPVDCTYMLCHWTGPALQDILVSWNC